MNSENFRKIEPYVPGEQPQDRDRVKLNTNENPYPPSPYVLRAAKEMNASALNLYPDPEARELVQSIADYHGVGFDNVFAGVGSDDVIAMCFMAFFNSEKPILFPDITYAFYDVWAELFKISYEKIPLDKNFTIVKEDYFRENGGIVFPNPNAPTGICMGLDDIRAIIEHNRDTAVIVDEAYIDFGGESAADMINEYDNLIVTRTFSKSRSMAGMRIGYAIADKALIAQLKTIKNSYNSYTLSTAAIKLGSAAIKDEEYFIETVAKIVKTRENTAQRLKKLGFSMTDSKSNFLFVTHEKMRAAEIFERLKEKRIYVRYFNKPRIDNYLRITIGTDAETDALIAALTEILEGAK